MFYTLAFGNVYPPMSSKNFPPSAMMFAMSSPNHSLVSAVRAVSTSLATFPATFPGSAGCGHEQGHRLTIMLWPFLSGLMLVAMIASATSSTVLAGSPLSFHLSEYPVVMCVGVKNGATTLTRTPS